LALSLLSRARQSTIYNLQLRRSHPQPLCHFIQQRLRCVVGVEIQEVAGGYGQADDLAQLDLVLVECARKQARHSTNDLLVALGRRGIIVAVGDAVVAQQRGEEGLDIALDEAVVWA
jgi:hypothetical protein